MKVKLFLSTLLFVACALQINANNPTYSFWTQVWIENSDGYQASSNTSLESYHTYNWNYKNRKLLHDAAQEYLIQLEMQNAFYVNPELEDYLYQLVHQIHPKAFPKQQKVQLNVKMIQSEIPEAFSFANGTILISTGMLSLLQSEDELMARLAREIAHIVLDHNVKTYTAIQTKNTIATILGATAYVASAVNSYDKNRDLWEAEYLAEIVGIGTELISHGILSALGVGYNRSRIYDADEVAQKWMMENNRDKYALSQAIRRLQFYEQENRGTHLALNENRFFITNRFENILKKKKFKLSPQGLQMMAIHADYDTRISDCLKTNAKLMVAKEFYTDAIPYIDRSIQSNWTSGETYLLKAIALRRTKYSEDDNKTILSLLDLAEENASSDLPWIWSERGLVHLRLQEDREALNAFTRFEQYFTEDQSETTLWVRKMIHKLKNKTNM